MKKFISSILAVVMVTGMSVTAFATEPEGEGESTVTAPVLQEVDLELPEDQDSVAGEVPVELTAEAAVFSVTVPAVLPVAVSDDGGVMVAEGAAIINKSSGAITVSSMVLEVGEGWEIQNFDEFDASTKKVGTKQYAMKIANEITDPEAENNITFDDPAWKVIEGKTSEEDVRLEFNYQAKVPAQDQEYKDADLGTITFTIGWYDPADDAGDAGEDPVEP